MITLKTLPTATEQEVFDQVATHLLHQGKQALGSTDEGCMYRMGDLKCAAGCLIAPDEYQPEFEKKKWLTLVEEKVVPAAHQELICMLQGIHDKYSPMDWVSGLRDLAKHFSLSDACIDQKLNHHA